MLLEKQGGGQLVSCTDSKVNEAAGGVWRYRAHCMEMRRSTKATLTCSEGSHSTLPRPGSMTLTMDCAMGFSTSPARPLSTAHLTAGEDASKAS